MGTWLPTEAGEVRCVRHDQVFAKGSYCPRCIADPPTEELIQATEAPRGGDLPGAVDHEGWYVSLSDRFNAEAIALLEDVKPQRARGKGKKKTPGQKGRKANPFLAARLADVAIKARRAAVEITRWREDWQKVEQLEEELRRMRGAH